MDLAPIVPLVDRSWVVFVSERLENYQFNPPMGTADSRRDAGALLSAVPRMLCEAIIQSSAEVTRSTPGQGAD